MPATPRPPDPAPPAEPGSGAAVVSFRLGGPDGVSVVAASWASALAELGWRVRTVAGEGPVDVSVPGLGVDPDPPAPDPDALAAEVTTALAGVDLAVVENLCTIPLNLVASRAVARVLAGRPAILHHHDPPWQRDRFAHITELPPDDDAWCHVVINELTRRQFTERGMEATVIRNGFPTDVAPGDRAATRTGLGVAPGERLVAHPVRAIHRKNVEGAVHLAEDLGATYWLWGPAEEGYGAELERILAGARCRVLRGEPATLADGYAAADAVVFPSTWEGFGNPPIEAALWRRPVAVGPYPVAGEISALGFTWFPTDDPGPMAAFLDDPDPAVLDRNRRVAVTHFDQHRVVGDLAALIDRAGWSR